jgi:hypothetical protein
MELSRQASLIPSGSLNSAILILGAGNIGSNVARTLVAIGATNVTIYDPDTVAEENVGPSLFGMREVGPNKAIAVAYMLERDYNVRIEATPEKFPLNSTGGAYRIVIQAIDDKQARRDIWYQVLKPNTNLRWQWLIDARMGADLFTASAIESGDTTDYGMYEEWLAIPESPLACGEKATAYQTQGLIPGLVGMFTAQIAREEKPPREIFMKTFSSYISITRR